MRLGYGCGHTQRSSYLRTGPGLGQVSKGKGNPQSQSKREKDRAQETEFQRQPFLVIGLRASGEEKTKDSLLGLREDWTRARADSMVVIQMEAEYMEMDH